MMAPTNVAHVELPESLGARTYTVVPGAIRAGCEVLTPHGQRLFYAYLSEKRDPAPSPATPVPFGCLPEPVRAAVNKTFADRFSMSGAEQDRLRWPAFAVEAPAPLPESGPGVPLAPAWRMKA